MCYVLKQSSSFIPLHRPCNTIHANTSCFSSLRVNGHIQASRKAESVKCGDTRAQCSESPEKREAKSDSRLRKPRGFSE